MPRFVTGPGRQFGGKDLQTGVFLGNLTRLSCGKQRACPHAWPHARDRHSFSQRSSQKPAYSQFDSSKRTGCPVELALVEPCSQAKNQTISQFGS